MTDNFGHEQHEEHNQENWQESQPPVDTFHDEDLQAEGMATVSEEAAAHEEFETPPEHAEGAEAAPVAKKMSKMIPLAAGGGLLLIIIVVVMMQFGGHSSSPPPTMTASQMPPIAPPPQTATADAGAPGSALVLTSDGKLKVGDQIAPVSDSSANDNSASLPAPSVASNGGSATPSAGALPSAVVPNPAAPPPVLGADAMQPASGALTVTTTSAIPAQPAAPVPAAPVAAVAATAADPNADARLTALSNRVEELQKSLDQATQQLTQVSAMMANGGGNANNSNGNVAADAAMQGRLDKIEQQLMQMNNRSSNTSNSSRPSLATPSVANPTVAKDNPYVIAPGTSPDMYAHEASADSVASSANPTASTSRHASTHKRHMMKASVSAPRHKKTHKKAVEDSGEDQVSLAPASGYLETPHSGGGSSSAWVLRAATPSDAWIARNSTTSDLRHVRVGEDLPGIGQVQAIRQVGADWVVEGTEGTIR